MILRNPRSLPSVEERTGEIGREIFARIDTRGPSIFRRQWWDNWVMDWSMKDEGLKVQLFRFIDVLATLRTPDAVAEHMDAYFGDAETRLPCLARIGSKWCKPRTWAGRKIAN